MSDDIKKHSDDLQKTITDIIYEEPSVNFDDETIAGYIQKFSKSKEIDAEDRKLLRDTYRYIKSLEFNIAELEKVAYERFDRVQILEDLLKKASSSFYGSVPIAEASYIRSVFISKPLIDDIFRALEGKDGR